MTTLLLCLALLAPQQPADSSRVQQLEEQVETLRSRIETLEERQDIRRGYYLDTITGERMAYAALLTGIGALFLIVSFAGINWRIKWTEDEVTRKLRDQKRSLENQINENEEKAEDLEEDIYGLKEMMKEYDNRIVKLETFHYSERVSEVMLAAGDKNALINALQFLENLTRVEPIKDEQMRRAHNTKNNIVSFFNNYNTSNESTYELVSEKIDSISENKPDKLEDILNEVIGSFGNFKLVDEDS